ncbi:hypothetical protein JB92DRAFT_3125416 [Gautieria morchelliformis]|nr:hypothetical protein JB92DRAFT_3125416 [Gautieria morchelliformis]
MAPNTDEVLRSGALVTSFQALYFGLTMYKLFIRVKAFGFSLTPLLKVFFRDGAGYCLIMLVMYLFVTVLFAVGAEDLQGIGELWLISIIAITAGRLVLNLRDVAADESDYNNNGEQENMRRGGTQFSSVLEAAWPVDSNRTVVA